MERRKLADVEDADDPDELVQINVRVPRRAAWVIMTLCRMVGAVHRTKKTDTVRPNIKVLLRMIAAGEIKLVRGFKVVELDNPALYYPLDKDARKKESRPEEKAVSEVNGEALRAGDYRPPPQHEPIRPERERSPVESEADDESPPYQEIWG